MKFKKEKKRKWFTYLYVLIILFPCFEIALRLIGATPYIQKDYSIESIPNHPFLGDSVYGISLNDGNYHITLNNKIIFNATHDKGSRVTKRNDSLEIEKNIVTLGCSFTYGYGVNDKETFSQLLQNNNQEYSINNMGVIGFGTIQSYLQLKNLLETDKKPDVALLIFSSYHLERNPMAASYRRALKIGFNNSIASNENVMNNSKFPFSKSKNGVDLNYTKWNDLYKDWKYREYLSSVNFLQTTWDKMEMSNLDLYDISKSIILEMNNICLKNKIDFRVVMLDDVSILSEKLRNNGVKLIEVNFDFSDTTITNLPYDMHPNSKGHEQIFNSINNQLHLIK